jgi:hypothetical protein
MRCSRVPSPESRFPSPDSQPPTTWKTRDYRVGALQQRLELPFGHPAPIIWIEPQPAHLEVRLEVQPALRRDELGVGAFLGALFPNCPLHAVTIYEAHRTRHVPFD